MRDVVPTLQGYDPLLAIDAPRDQRDLFLQVLLDHARTIGSRSGTWHSSSRSTSPKAPTSNRISSSTTARGAASSCVHADPRELRLIDGDVFYEDVRIDVAYRDYEIRDLLALEQEDGRRLDGIRALFLQNRMVSAIGGDLDHKSCWEVLTSDELAARYFSIAERQLFRRHVLWTRIVSERRTDTPDGPMDLLEYAARLPRGARAEAEPRLRRHGRALGAALSQGEWEALLERSARRAARSPPALGRAGGGDAARASVSRARRARPHARGAVLRRHGFRADGSRLGIIARVSQKQVVNVAQRGGLAAVLVGYRPEDLEELDALARAGGISRARVARDRAPNARSRRRDSSARVGRGDLSAARCGRGSRLAARRARCLAARSLGGRPARRFAGGARSAREDLTARERMEIDAWAASGGRPSRCRRVSSRPSPRRARIASRHGSGAARRETTRCSWIRSRSC